MSDTLSSLTSVEVKRQMSDTLSSLTHENMSVCLTEFEVVVFQSALMFQAVNCHQYPTHLYQIML
jgi:hypothetical protein